jgi:hypothetical protein
MKNGHKCMSSKMIVKVRWKMINLGLKLATIFSI